MLRQRPEPTLREGGRPHRCIFARVAQLAEHRTCNAKVRDAISFAGSRTYSLVRSHTNVIYAVESADFLHTRTREYVLLI